LNQQRIGNKLSKNETTRPWKVLFLDEKKNMDFFSGLNSLFHRGGGLGGSSTQRDLSIWSVSSRWKCSCSL